MLPIHFKERAQHNTSVHTLSVKTAPQKPAQPYIWPWPRENLYPAQDRTHPTGPVTSGSRSCLGPQPTADHFLRRLRRRFPVQHAAVAERCAAPNQSEWRDRWRQPSANQRRAPAPGQGRRWAPSASRPARGCRGRSGAGCRRRSWPPGWSSSAGRSPSGGRRRTAVSAATPGYRCAPCRGPATAEHRWKKNGHCR